MDAPKEKKEAPEADKIHAAFIIRCHLKNRPFALRLNYGNLTAVRNQILYSFSISIPISISIIQKRLVCMIPLTTCNAGLSSFSFTALCSPVGMLFLAMPLRKFDFHSVPALCFCPVECVVRPVN
jgi:hypothetical protein